VGSAGYRGHGALSPRATGAALAARDRRPCNALAEYTRPGMEGRVISRRADYGHGCRRSGRVVVRGAGSDVFSGSSRLRCLADDPGIRPLPTVDSATLRVGRGAGRGFPSRSEHRDASGVPGGDDGAWPQEVAGTPGDRDIQRRTGRTWIAGFVVVAGVLYRRWQSGSRR